jgi:TolB protein
MKKFLSPASIALGALVLFAFAHRSAGADNIGLFGEQQNIGNTPKKGRTEYDSKKNEYTVSGGGANIWAKEDAFEYVYKQISGDITLTADIHFEGQGVEHHRKAALMIRQSLAPDAAYADAALHGDGLTSLQYRPTAGDATQEMRSDLKGPIRIRIERHGNQFTMAAGNPGEELKTTGPATISLQDPVYIGLAACSHNADVIETAVFSNVSIEPQGQKQSNEAHQLLAKEIN